MPNHRMFSNRIANSAKFLQMPLEAQLLYFHMVLRADDDGIVETYPLMKLLGIAPDNFKILLAKEFIKQLNEDQVIVIIDWQEHNKIRADRKIDSIYLPLLKEKYPDLKTLKPKARTDVIDNSKRLGGGQSTDGVSKDKLRQDKIRQVKLSKDKISKDLSAIADGNQIQILIELFKSINPSYERLFSNTTQRNALERLVKKWGVPKIQRTIEALPKIINKPFAPRITTPLQLETKLGDLISFYKQNEKNNKNTIIAN